MVYGIDSLGVSGTTELLVEERRVEIAIIEKQMASLSFEIWSRGDMASKEERAEVEVYGGEGVRTRWKCWRSALSSNWHGYLLLYPVFIKYLQAR